jgi:hypothetical protein
MGCPYRKNERCNAEDADMLAEHGHTFECQVDCKRIEELVAQLRPRRAPTTDKLEECARDEIMRFVVERGLEQEDVEWLLEWAHRRRTQLLDIAEEGLLIMIDADGASASAAYERLEDLARVGRATLRRMGVQR